jgi:branched-chain amino acid transport system permease protein
MSLLPRMQWRTRPSNAVLAPALASRQQPKPGSEILRVINLSKMFGGLKAVSDVSFDLAAGEILGLIGPNGAGKTTLFNLLSGALKPTGGEIRLNGDNVTAVPAFRLVKLGIARTFQHVKLRPDMTVLENVLVGCYTRTESGFLRGALGLDRAERGRAVQEAQWHLKRVGLLEKADDRAGNLPLGEQRMLEVARALAADPMLILLDEPAAGLRHLEKAALAELLRQIRNDGCTVLLIEHDMSFVMGLVDRLVVLDFGTKIAEGQPADIRTNEEVNRAYLGASR